MTTQSETGCCAKFDPAPWDEKEHVWQNKKFIKGHIISFLHMPLNFGSVMMKLCKQIEAAHAEDHNKIWLTNEKSAFSTELYVSTTKDVPNAVNFEISGTFLSKVFEGPYSNMGRWIASMKEFASHKGKDIKRLYFWYTTCPKCAKHYGKNHTVIFAEV